MPNTYRLGGSPLGLINVLSRPTRDNMSTFNGGRSRNINVISYNRGRPQETSIIQNNKQIIAPRSLYSGGSIPNFFPITDPVNKTDDEFGLSASTQFKNPSDQSYRDFPSKLHNDRVYDLSLLNIIEVLSKSGKAALRPQDFAYLKQVGVYPNNRLMIARRFNGPIGDNIYTGKGGSPKAILIGWKPETEDFLEFTFGEEWIDADADFTSVLNRVGQDFGLDNLGGSVGSAFNIIPLPGISEVLQRTVLVQLGLLTADQALMGGRPLPSGNPNIIKMAKRRKTIGYGEADSGLKCSIQIKMEVEYEQKFISGIDPSIAFMDILNNIMVFGTSKSDDYGLAPGFTKKIKQYLDNPGQLVKDIIEGIRKGVTAVKDELTKAAKKVLDALNEATEQGEEDAGGEDSGEPQEYDGPSTEDNQAFVDKAKKVISGFLDKLNSYFKKYLSKYKVEILGIANALSGAPSTPWHITLGNPIRPLFCSGDMYVSDNVTLTFGPVLAFNDLPASIKASFTLSNARPLGMQEILAKFNVGHLRVVNVRRDFIETNEVLTSTGEFTVGNGAGAYFDAVFDASGEQLNPIQQQQQNNTAGLTPGSGSNADQATSEVNAVTEQLKKEKEELDKIKAEKGETSTEYTTAKANYDAKVTKLASQAQNANKQGANTEVVTPAPGGGGLDPNATIKVGDVQTPTQGNASTSGSPINTGPVLPTPPTP